MTALNHLRWPGLVVVLAVMCLANEARGDVLVPLALVLGELREGAERARHRDAIRRVVADVLGSRDSLRSVAALRPVHEGPQHVEGVWSGPPSAVQHAGREEQAEEL